MVKLGTTMKKKYHHKRASTTAWLLIEICSKPVAPLICIILVFCAVASLSALGKTTDTQKSSDAISHYKALMKSFRPQKNSLIGPLALSSLPPETRNQFMAFDTELRGSQRFANIGHSKTQVSRQGWPFMDYDKEKKEWSSTWSRDLVDELLNEDSSSRDISCEDYPGSAAQVKTALEFVRDAKLEENQKASPHVLVAGSISPWIEVLVLNSSLKPEPVFVTDYNPIIIEDPRIKFISMEELKSLDSSPEYDVIVSYSSIEHDGIGRYGDPIHPMGDMAAMAEFHTMLKAGGILILGVPVVTSDDMSGFIAANWHRVYSTSRLQKLMCGFEHVMSDERIDPPGMEMVNGTRSVKVDWQYQPVFVLKKTKTFDCYQQILKDYADIVFRIGNSTI